MWYWSWPQIIGLGASCDRYDLELDIINNSPEFASFYREHEKLFDYVASRSGITVSTEDIFSSVKSLWDVYDDLFVEVSSLLQVVQDITGRSIIHRETWVKWKKTQKCNRQETLCARKTLPVSSFHIIKTSYFSSTPKANLLPQNPASQRYES